MALSEIFGALRNRRQEQESSLWRRYFLVVQALAESGGEVDADEVCDVMEQLEKSEADLESDIALFKKRQELAAQVEAGKGAFEKAQAEMAKIGKLNAAYHEYTQRHNQQVYDLRQQAIRYETLNLQATEAARQLQETSPFPWLDRQQADIRQRLRAISDRERELRERKRDKELHLRWHEEKGYDDDAAKFAAQLEAINQELVDIGNKQAELNQQMAALNAEKMAV